MVGQLAGRPFAALALGALALLPQAPQAPHPGVQSGLNGVYCTSRASCWAVGFESTGKATLNEVLHWNGARWSPVTVPSQGGSGASANSQLQAVRCTSAANCWAVGYYLHKGATLDQALHWNGKKWSVAATPDPGGAVSGDFSQLFDVTCTSAGSCWAAGYFGTADLNLNQVLHWNGRKWSLATVPDPAGKTSGSINTLASVKCGSPRSCWAVGDDGSAGGVFVLKNQLLHWNGTKWSVRKVPNPGGTGSGDVSLLTGVTCTSAESCWAAGSYHAGGAQLNQVLRWTGATWTVVTVPQPAGISPGSANSLFAISCPAAHDCWAAGGLGPVDTGSDVVNEALHWTGSAWTAASLPQPGGTSTSGFSVLQGIRCTDAADCWAVGSFHGPSKDIDRNQILRWRNGTWSAS